MAHEPVRSEHDSWMYDNTRGLSLYAAAEWEEAAEAFAAAADVLARRAPAVSSHDALALILGNLAQACFQAGRTEEALSHAQRACALRVAITGGDALPVARQRMDLAVMLGACGRLDEARALIQRAIAAVEQHVGDEDVRLVVILDNAARLALAAGDPASAEPILLRLHALLGAHGLSTQRADLLLARVAAVRTRADATEIAAAPAEARRDVADVAVYAHASILELDALEILGGPDGQDVAHAQDVPDVPDAPDAQDDWDDQPLRDAVALTDVLLRATPSGVIAIQEAVHHDLDILAAFETVVDPTAAPMVDLADDLSTPTLDIALDLADDFALAPPADAVPSTALGFTVDHTPGASDAYVPPLDAGNELMGLELDDALADALLNVPTPPVRQHDVPVAVPVAVPVVASEPFSALNAPLRPPVHHAESEVPYGFGPPPAAVVIADASSAPIAPPAPVPPTARDLTRAQDARNAAARNDDRGRASAPVGDRPPRTDRTPTADRRPKPTSGGRRAGAIGAGIGAALAVGGAVWYFLLR